MVSQLGGTSAAIPIRGSQVSYSSQRTSQAPNAPQFSGQAAKHSAGAHLFDGGIFSIPLLCGACCCAPAILGAAMFTKTGRTLIKLPFKLIGGIFKLVTKPKEALGDIWQGIKDLPGTIKNLFSKTAE